mgnify:FL=1
MSYELEGILHKKYDTETKGDNFQVREFVVKVEGQYPQFAKFQLSGDKCGLISEIAEGWKVKVSFNIVGREWQEKFFTNLSAWKIAVTGRTLADDSHIEDAEVETPF